MMKNLCTLIKSCLHTLLIKIPARQRPLLFIGLFFSFLPLVWLLLLASVSSANSKLRQEIDGKKQELIWMRWAAQEVKQYAPDAGQGTSPQVIIEDSAYRFGLAPAVRRIEPGTGCEIQIRLENAVFDELLRWLIQLKQEQGINVVEIVVEPRQSGLTDVRLTLARGG